MEEKETKVKAEGRKFYLLFSKKEQVFIIKKSGSHSHLLEKPYGVLEDDTPLVKLPNGDVVMFHTIADNAKEFCIKHKCNVVNSKTVYSYPLWLALKSYDLTAQLVALKIGNPGNDESYDKLIGLTRMVMLR